METQQMHVAQKEDYSKKNRSIVLNKIVRHWREKFGNPTPNQFNFISDLAYEIADELPSSVPLDGKKLSVSQILESEQVQTAKTTKSYLASEEAAQFANKYPVPYAKRTPEAHSGAMWAVIGGVAGLVLTLIALFVKAAIG